MSKLNHISKKPNLQGSKKFLNLFKKSLHEEKYHASQYSTILNRLNLQSIGYYIKEGSKLLSVDKTSFSKREETAERTLDKKLHLKLDEKTIHWLYPVILEYTSKKEEIQFSQGMKAGAKLILLLTDDSEYDF